MQVINGTEKQAEVLLQKEARENEKLKLMSWILADMQICELMNTDKMEYLYQLKDLIDSFINKCKKGDIK